MNILHNVFVILILRVLHIGGGIMWVGSAALYLLFLVPVARSIHPAGQKFLQSLGPKLGAAMGIIATVTVVSGALLYARFMTGGISVIWRYSCPGFLHSRFHIFWENAGQNRQVGGRDGIRARRPKSDAGTRNEPLTIDSDESVSVRLCPAVNRYAHNGNRTISVKPARHDKRQSRAVTVACRFSPNFNARIGAFIRKALRISGARRSTTLSWPVFSRRA